MMETMAKKIDNKEKETIIKMLTPETFNLDVKKFLERIVFKASGDIGNSMGNN